MADLVSQIAVGFGWLLLYTLAAVVVLFIISLVIALIVSIYCFVTGITPPKWDG